MDFSKVIERWLNFVSTDNSLFENIQLPDGSDSTYDNIVEKCCFACSCQPGQCITETRVNESDDTCVMNDYTWQCGCQEICYSFEGKKVGHSQKSCCDGSKTLREYRSVLIISFHFILLTF